MRTRIISGAILVLILAGVLLGGYTTVFIFGLFISLVGLFELYRVVHIEKKAIGIMGYLLAIGYYAMEFFEITGYFELYCASTAIIVMIVYVLTFSKVKADQVAFSVLGIFYIAIPVSFLYRIIKLEDGIYIFILIFICSWIADTCAYFTGVTFGKHKLAAVLSPKKSIEGAVGGILGSMIIGFIYGSIVGSYLEKEMALIFMVICMFGSIVSIFGDLAASGIKRNYQVKDYGHLIPGHGGILDRFDSMIFVAPLVYGIASFLI